LNARPTAWPISGAQNKNNQENAKAQKLANKQLGGIRTATEAAQAVKAKQVEADQQRG
jgi:hypothetical protein